MNDILNRVRFLSVPESLRVKIEDSNDFSIDPNIPIPAEIPEGKEFLDVKELTWEMITAGMLRVIQSGQMPERHDYYRRFVLTLRPGILGEFTEAAIFKAHNGDFDLALTILDMLAGLFPHLPSVLLNRALVLEERAMHCKEQDRQKAVEETQAAYQQAMSVTPLFPDAFFNAGLFYLEQKDFAQALNYLSQYLEIADNEEKKEYAQKIIKDIEANGLDDEDFSRAYELLMQDREEEGLKHIKEFIENHPKVWNGWFMLGWALRRLKRWEDGAAAFKQALELGGKNSDTHNECAICLMETGDLKGARRELEAALHDDPENVKIISNLGVLAMRSGDNPQAAAFFRTVLELSPEDPLAKKYLRGWGLGTS